MQLSKMNPRLLILNIFSYLTVIINQYYFKKAMLDSPDPLCAHFSPSVHIKQKVLILLNFNSNLNS